MKKMRMIGTVEVKSTVNLDDLLAALPEEEQVFMLLKAFLQFDVRVKITLRRIKRNTDEALQEREDEQ